MSDPTPHSLRALADAGDPDIAYQKLAAGGHSLPAMPRFILGDFPADAARRYVGETMWRDVGLFTVRGIDLIGEGLLYRGDELLICDGIDVYPGTLPLLLRRQRAVIAPRAQREVAGAAVLLIGIGYETYGHWLVDVLPKLYALLAAGHAPDTLRYLVPSDTPRFGLAWLDLLGIAREQRITYDPLFDCVRAETLLIPELLRTNSRVTPLFAAAAGFLNATIDAAHAALPATAAGPRIFVSRARAGRGLRPLGNRAAIEAIAAARGFVVVHPEALELAEQIALFRAARQIVGEYGSALHASLFAPAGTVVTALRGDLSPIVGYLQSAIGAALGQPTGYVFGRTDPSDAMQAFTVDEAEFALCLDQVLGGMLLA